MTKCSEEEMVAQQHVPESQQSGLTLSARFPSGQRGKREVVDVSDRFMLRFVTVQKQPGTLRKTHFP